MLQIHSVDKIESDLSSSFLVGYKKGSKTPNLFSIEDVSSYSITIFQLPETKFQPTLSLCKLHSFFLNRGDYLLDVNLVFHGTTTFPIVHTLGFEHKDLGITKQMSRTSFNDFKWVFPLHIETERTKIELSLGPINSETTLIFPSLIKIQKLISNA